MGGKPNRGVILSLPRLPLLDFNSKRGIASAFIYRQGVLEPEMNVAYKAKDAATSDFAGLLGSPRACVHEPRTVGADDPSPRRDTIEQRTTPLALLMAIRA